jgi:hypothetical protein
MGEILSDYTSCVDSTSTLLWKHVKFLSNDEILIFMPCTKTKKYNGEFVDVFAIRDSFCCPVSLLKRTTTRKLNEILKDLLRPWYNPRMDLISGHSFRGAVANIMQKNSHTFSKSDCQYLGRWASSAYTVYLRQHRAERKLLFNKLSNVLNTK